MRANTWYSHNEHKNNEICTMGQPSTFFGELKTETDTAFAGNALEKRISEMPWSTLLVDTNHKWQNHVIHVDRYLYIHRCSSFMLSTVVMWKYAKRLLLVQCRTKCSTRIFSKLNSTLINLFSAKIFCMYMFPDPLDDLKMSFGRQEYFNALLSDFCSVRHSRPLLIEILRENSILFEFPN